MHMLRYVSINVCGHLRIQQVRWCMLIKLETHFKHVTNKLQYVGIHCHRATISQNFVLA